MLYSYIEMNYPFTVTPDNFKVPNARSLNISVENGNTIPIL